MAKKSIKKAKKVSKICCICGVNETTSFDHIPPECIFLKPFPKNRIKVPACSKCNTGRAKIDEKFKAYLSINVNNPETPSTKLFSSEALRTVLHNRKLFREILTNSKPAMLIKNNLYLPNYFLVNWDAQVFNIEIEYIARGLYYYHYKEILGKQVLVIPIQPKKYPEKLVDVIDLLNINHIGDEQFSYIFGRAKEHKHHSIWFFQFYNTLVAACRTKPII